MIRFFGLLLVAAAPEAVPPGAPVPHMVLTGIWAGDGFALHATTKGYVVQGRCASGKIESRIITDADGRFRAGGYFNPKNSGYRLSDFNRRDVPTIFTGQVGSDTLALTVAAAGQSDVRYILKRGAKASFPKCD